MLGGLLGGLYDWTIGNRVKLIATSVVVLSVILVFGYVELRRQQAIADKVAAEAELKELKIKLKEAETERDKLRATLTLVSQQRKRTLDTTASLKVQQKKLSSDLAAMRERLQESTSREQQCLDALAEVRRHFRP